MQYNIWENKAMQLYKETTIIKLILLRLKTMFIYGSEKSLG